jgi:uncharacterized protein
MKQDTVRGAPVSVDGAPSTPSLSAILQQQGWVWGVMGIIAIAELLVTWVSPWWGLFLHTGIVVGLLYSLALPMHTATYRLVLVLLLIPLIRLLSLGLPLQALPQISWYGAVAVPLFAAMWILARKALWTRAEMGLMWGKWKHHLLFTGVGLGLGWIEYFILAPTPLAPTLMWQDLWLPALVLLLFTGLLEELLFRGFLQSAAIAVMGKWSGIIFVALLFAVMHIGYRSMADFLFVFAAGLLFGVFTARTGSIVGVTLAHGLTNMMLFLVLPHLLQ